MEVVTGTISRVTFATNGDLKFSFARDLTEIARNAIRAAREPIPDASVLPELGLHGIEMSVEGFSHQPAILEVRFPAFQEHLDLTFRLADLVRFH